MTRLARRHDAEILDEGLLDGRPIPAELLRGSLRHVAAVDRWLGGERALRGHLERCLPEKGAARILDVGTGNGVLLRRLVGRLRSEGWACTGVGVDLDPGHLAAAGDEDGRRHDDAPVHLVRADGLRLPLADGSVDVAIAVLALHHFDRPTAVAILREMARVSRRSVLVSDLRRSVPAWIGARLLAATVWRRNPITRHDGPLSVLRAFTPGELAALAREAGLRQVHVASHPLFRLVLEASSGHIG